MENGRWPKGKIPWNKGLTKETDERVAKSAEKNIDSHKGQSRPHSKETKRKISESHKGIRPSDESREKMSKSSKGQHAWNKGVELSEEHRQNLSESHKGYEPPEEVRRKMGLSRSGDKNPNWKGGITALTEQIRKCFKYRQWTSDVFTHDDFTCQECGQRGGYLNAHHIKSFGLILQYYEITTLGEALECAELWNINNGITLCEECHIEIHIRLKERKK